MIDLCNDNKLVLLKLVGGHCLALISIDHQHSPEEKTFKIVNLTTQKVLSDIKHEKFSIRVCESSSSNGAAASFSKQNHPTDLCIGSSCPSQSSNEFQGQTSSSSSFLRREGRDGAAHRRFTNSKEDNGLCVVVVSTEDTSI